MKIISKLYALAHKTACVVLTVASRRFPFMKKSLIFFKKAVITTINTAANAHSHALDLRIAEFWWHLITSIWG